MNGDCPVGAKNKADINNFEREQKEQNRRISKVEGKLDQLTYLVIATLAGVVINLVLLLAQGNAGV